MKFFVLIFLLLSLPIQAYGIFKPSTTQLKQVYKLNETDLYDVVSEGAYLYKSKSHEKKSAEELVEKASRYYVPKISLSHTSTKNFISDETPKKEGDIGHAVSAGLESKVWGSAVGDQIKVADYNLKKADMSLKIEQDKLYSVIVKNLMQVEVNRELKAVSIHYKEEMASLYKKIKRKYRNGLAEKSDLSMAKLAITNFEDALNKSDDTINNLFYNIEISTGFDLGNKKEDIGITQTFYQSISSFDTDVLEMDDDLLANSNYKLNQSFYNLASKKYGAASKNEMLDVSVKLQDDMTNLYESGKAKNELNLSITVSLKGLNYQSHKDKASAVELFLGAKDKYQYDSVKLKNTIKKKFYKKKSIMNKIAIVTKQLELTETLINQKYKEIAINESSYFEIITNITKLQSLQSSLASNRSELVGINVDILSEYGLLLNDED